MSELPKTFDPAEIEARWYARWEADGLFRPARDAAEPWTIVMPPPNVTGSLHIGHALDITLQDILTRHARLQGKDALWVVGTDHAGIATQMVVERQLAERQQKRTDFTREEFVAKVWEWKAESGGAITGQLRRLGASCDWANERFTMDEGFSAAVVKVFVQLYRDKLLYRDKRLVNWDPKFQTAISDLEVETREMQGHFWHLRYPLEDESGVIHVATTRPETMLADMAVAVHPDDDRYRRLIGSSVRLPLTGRLVPIIADEHADPELGSGAVKITPGHDFNDFEVGRRAGFKPVDMLNMFDAEARVVQCGSIPDELLGLDRFEARKRVVELLEEGGHLDRVEDRLVQLPYGDRSGVVIEPWLTDQWYVDAATLAIPAIAAVRSGDIRVVPETWKKTWFNWLENIQPWCVSRQLWWGHQIPAWYGPVVEEIQGERHFIYYNDVLFDQKQNRPGDEQVFVGNAEAEAIEAAVEFYRSEKLPDPKIVIKETREEAARFAREEGGGQIIALFRDPDVLDTWFSSALWPFVTLGWPEETETLKRHYPNDVLISGFDIIFFWDARMAMMGFHFMHERPWKTLYLHGLVRDARGQKMSKSKGNTVDPLGLIDRYGADALRFTLAAMESQGRDIKLDEKRVEGYRNFATKLWNAARFCQGSGIGASKAIEPPAATLPVNRWIVGETVKTVQALDIALAELRYDESANTIYHFVWATFCDWYLELIKPALAPLPLDGGGQGGGGVSAGTESVAESTPPPTPPHQGEGGDAAETREVAAWVLDQILVMLHPFMPFVTEELWNAMADRPYPLILAKWPMPDARALDPEASDEIEWLIRLVGEIRSARTELNIPPGLKMPMVLGAGSKLSGIERWDRHRPVIERLARVTFDEVRPLPENLTDTTKGWAEIAQELLQTVRAGSMAISVGGLTVFATLEGVIDIEAERARLAKAAEAAETDRDSLAARLANPSFVERAKPEAVEKARADHAEKASDAEKYRAALARLG